MRSLRQYAARSLGPPPAPGLRLVPPLPRSAIESALDVEPISDVMSASDLWLSEAEKNDEPPSEKTPVTTPSRHAVYPPALPETEPPEPELPPHEPPSEH